MKMKQADSTARPANWVNRPSLGLIRGIAFTCLLLALIPIVKAEQSTNMDFVCGEEGEASNVLAQIEYYHYTDVRQTEAYRAILQRYGEGLNNAYGRFYERTPEVEVFVAATTNLIRRGLSPNQIYKAYKNECRRVAPSFSERR